jgi:hypothetical protein
MAGGGRKSCVEEVDPPVREQHGDIHGAEDEYDVEPRILVASRVSKRIVLCKLTTRTL